MKETVGDLWGHVGKAVVCVTTNGIVKADGKLVMGRGVALEAAKRHPDIPAMLGEMVGRYGNHAYALPHGLVSFPTKTDWKLPSDPDLIAQSARELVALADLYSWKTIVVPRPGCENGRLEWSRVKAILEPIFDDRFVVISRGLSQL